MRRPGHPSLRVGVPPAQWGLPAGTSVGRIWTAALPRLARTCRVLEADPRGRHRRVDVWLTDGHQGPIDVAEPVVAHLHEAIWDDPDGASLLDPAFVAHYGPLSEAAARSATLVMTGSGAARDQLVRVYGLDPARVRVAYDGVDVELHRPGLQGGADIVGRAGGDPDRPYVLFVGTLHPRKNLPVLREAMAALAAEGHPHALVLVAGPAPDRVDSADLAAAATAPLVGRPVVNLAGISDEDLAALMGGAAALCLPSLLEGFGLPVVEAMASGTPVVVADRGSLPEVVGDAGVVVPPDAASVAAGLRSVLDDPARAAELAIAGRARAERFSWDAMVESWSEVLHEAAGRVSAGRAPADR